MMWLRVACMTMLVLWRVEAQDPGAVQKQAASALTYEKAHIGKDCVSSQTTLDMNSCIGGVQAKTESNLKIFLGSLQALLKSDAEASQKSQAAQAAWEKYAAASCDAIDAFYRTGTIRVTAVSGCHIQLIRSRMQDLDAIYYDTLHN